MSTMKQVVLIPLLLAVASYPSLARPSNPLVNCDLVSEFARAVMNARQSNADMSKVMSTLSDESGKVEAWKRYIVIKAYDQIRWETSERQRAAIQDFKNAAYLECTKGIAR